jgi:uncharacterized membrane protein YraQ (UPF0718 family)
MINKIKKLSGGVNFMLGMIAIYLIAGIANPSLVMGALNKSFQTFVGLLPILALVFGIIFIINLFLDPEKIKKHLGHESGMKGWLYAILASILITAPPYVMLPLLGQLKKHGMKYSLLAVFLENKNVQLVFLPVMAYYFGVSFTVVISVYIMIFSILSGIFIGKIMQEIEPAKIN